MLAMRRIEGGFSMVELMIAVVIIGILFSVGAPSFMVWVQNAQIRTAAESISNGLQMARAEAVRLNTSVQFSFPGGNITNAPPVWVVQCINDLNGNGVEDAGECYHFIQRHLSAEGATNVLINATATSITFNGLGQANNSSGNMLNIRIENPTGGDYQYQNSGPMRCLNVRVEAGGRIRMCNPSILDLTNPQSCS